MTFVSTKMKFDSNQIKSPTSIQHQIHVHHSSTETSSKRHKAKMLYARPERRLHKTTTPHHCASTIANFVTKWEKN